MPKPLQTVLTMVLVFTLTACSNMPQDADLEDYESFITPRPAEQESQELGVPFNCFPSKPGELGADLTEDYSLPDAKEHEITLNIFCRTGIYSVIDPHNFTELKLQYLNSEGQLVVETLYDGQDCIVRRNDANGKTLYEGRSEERSITLRIKEGKPFYYAIFSSPYGKLDVSTEILLDGAPDDALEQMQYDYFRSAESFHITDFGVQYLIFAKAIYLP